MFIFLDSEVLFLESVQGIFHLTTFNIEFSFSPLLVSFHFRIREMLVVNVMFLKAVPLRPASLHAGSDN